jgi:putative FmdB family regulatory protein
VPTYQYVCTNPEGKHEFELVQSFTDAPPTECPVCGSPVRKVYGSVGVVFKGSGFYRTDSRAGASSGNGSSAKSSGDSSTSPSSGDTKSSSPSSSGDSSKSSGDSTKSSGDSSKSSSSSSSGTGSAGKAAN